MRLGEYKCHVEPETIAYKAYRKNVILERHRHRYEFNPEYEKVLTYAGLTCSGKNREHGLVEIIELRNHPWFLGCQFHPEFQSRPLEPHPLFRDFIGASHAHRIQRNRRRTSR